MMTDKVSIPTLNIFFYLNGMLVNYKVLQKDLYELKNWASYQFTQKFYIVKQYAFINLIRS